MEIRNFDNNEQIQERIEFFKSGVSYGLLKEEGRYDVYVVSEGLPSGSFETISGQLQQTVSLFYLYPIGDNYLKMKMRELLIRNIDILSKKFDGFANLDIVKEYKSDILILKDKCLKLISDFMNGNGEDKEMIKQFNTIKSEIDELYKKMIDDEDLKDYHVVHLQNVKNLEEIDRRLQEIKEKHKNWKESEDKQDFSSVENNQEIVIQSAKVKYGEKSLIQRIKKFLSSILNS